MKKSSLLWIRLTASGAIVGLAVGNLVMQHFGLQWPIDDSAAQALSAILGSGVAAIAVKALHVV